MSMQRLFEIVLVTGLVFALLDLVWLTTVVKKFYYRHLGYLLREKADPLASVAFYVIYVIGLTYFAMIVALNGGIWQLAVLNGALYGLFCYAAYDLTNLATIRDWPKRIVLVDIAWGTVLSGVTAGLSYLILQYI